MTESEFIARCVSCEPGKLVDLCILPLAWLDHLVKFNNEVLLPVVYKACLSYILAKNNLNYSLCTVTQFRRTGLSVTVDVAWSLYAELYSSQVRSKWDYGCVVYGSTRQSVLA